MAIPSLILGPRESRSRYGTVTPETAGAVEPTGEGWRLWKGIGEPVLLLTPEDTRLQGDPHAPVVADGVEVVPGPHGLDWKITHRNSSPSVWVPYPFTAPPTEGTVITRVLRYPSPEGAPQRSLYFPRSHTTEKRFTIGSYFTGARHANNFRVDTSGRTASETSAQATDPNAWDSNERRTFASRWGDGFIRLYNNGEERAATPFEGAPFSPSTPIYYGASESVPSDYDNIVLVEGGLIYDRVLSADEIDYLSNMDRKWTWGPDGVLAVPHPEPVGDLLVRYREGGVLKSEHLYGPGRFGASGIARWEDGQLTITTDASLELLGLIAYPAEASVSAFGMGSRGGEPAPSESVMVEGDALSLWVGTTNHYLRPLAAESPMPFFGYSHVAISRITDAGMEHPVAGTIDTATRTTITAGPSSNALIGTSYVDTGPLLVVGQPISAQMLVRPSPELEGAEVMLQVMVGGGATSSTSSFTRYSMNGPTLISHTHVVDEDDRDAVYIYAQIPRSIQEASVGGYIDATAVQVENHPFPTPFTPDTREDSTLTIPLRTAPRQISVTYREGDTEATATLTGSGTFGQYGRAELNGTTLTITTDRQTELLALIVDNELGDEEAQRLLQTNVWRWNTVIDDPGAVMFLNDDGPIGGVMILEDEGNMNVIIGGT